MRKIKISLLQKGGQYLSICLLASSSPLRRSAQLRNAALRKIEGCAAQGVVVCAGAHWHKVKRYINAIFIGLRCLFVVGPFFIG